MKKLLSVVLAVSLLVSLCGCFPSAEKNASKDNKKGGESAKLTVETLSSQPEHIKQELSKRISIDADVDINIKNNFNVYTAVSKNYDFDMWKEIFFNGEEVVESSDHNNIESASSKKYDLIKWSDDVDYEYQCEELGFKNRYLSFYYNAKDKNRNKLLEPDRDTIFAKKELSVMSSEKALNLVKKKFEQLGISAVDYKIYSIDYDYISKLDKEYKIDEGDEKFNVKHNKDDEYYVIIPKISLPNESLMSEVQYYIEDDNGVLQEIKGAVTYAAVGKKGILDFKGQGIYDITEEKTDVKEIIDFNAALETLKEEYDGGSATVEVNNIEFAYVPYLIDAKKKTYEIKPTWVFTEKKTIHLSETNYKQIIDLIDAVTGEYYEYEKEF